MYNLREIERKKQERKRKKEGMRERESTTHASSLCMYFY